MKIEKIETDYRENVITRSKTYVTTKMHNHNLERSITKK